MAPFTTAEELKHGIMTLEEVSKQQGKLVFKSINVARALVSVSHQPITDALPLKHPEK